MNKYKLISANEVDAFLKEQDGWKTLLEGDVLTTELTKFGYTTEVIKVYRMTNFKRLLLWAGLKKSWFLGIKVKPFTQLFVDL